jgi:hypothetical protein
VNFFGHALVAGRERDDPAFVLGSMMPDLASMVGRRLVAVADRGLAEGVAFHHRTDTAFHASPGFLLLCRTARKELSSEGVPRPQTMATAHVGVELILDGVWARDEVAVARFLRALDAARDLAASLRWHGNDGPARWAALGERLRSLGAPHHYRDPRHLTIAVERVLSRRPRLALEDAHLPAVRRCLTRLQPQVHDRSEVLLQEIDLALGQRA